jgi:hypothetical protein
MVRRLLCLMLILPLVLLSVPACGADTKPPSKGTPVPDPEGSPKPRPAGGKAG